MSKLYGFGGKNVSMQVFVGKHAQATEEEKTGWAALASLGSELAVEAPESLYSFTITHDFWDNVDISHFFLF